MRTILLLAYAISPTKGSEYAVAWNYVIEMSKSNKIIVLYGKSDREMGNVQEISEYLKHQTIPNVTFIQVDSSAGKEGIIYSNYIKTILKDYLSYKNWHLRAYEVALELIKSHPIDIVHFLCPIGFKEPGYLWQLPLPYMWGPIAGAHPRPKALFPVLNFSQKIMARFRNIIHPLMLQFSPRVSSAMKRANVILAATPKTQEQISRYYSKTAYYLPEHGIRYIEKDIAVLKQDDEPLTLIWIGRIDPYKGLKIILEALKNLKIKNGWKLHAIGTGESFEEYHSYAQKWNINDRIVWHHVLPRETVQFLLAESHLHLITSLGEATSTVLIEALSKGIPTITLDHCGMAGVVDESNGIKIPIQSYHQIVSDLTAHLTFLNDHPEQINKMSYGAFEKAKSLLWSERTKFFNQRIEDAISDFKSNH